MFTQFFEKSAVSVKGAKKKIVGAAKATGKYIKEHKGQLASGSGGAAVGALSTDPKKDESGKVGALRGAVVGLAAHSGLKNTPKIISIRSKSAGPMLIINKPKTNSTTFVRPRGGRIGAVDLPETSVHQPPSISKAIGHGVIGGYLAKRIGPKHKSEKIKKGDK